MPAEPFLTNWMVAVAEAAEVAGATDFDSATPEQMIKAWDLVTRAAKISRPALTDRIASQAQLAVADLLAADPHATALVPAELARRRTVLPLRCSERSITIATANPLSQDAKREIAGLASRTVTFEVAPPGDLVSAIYAVYGERERFPIPTPKRPETAQPGGPHILVVDDEAGQRALLRSVLEEGGFRVSSAKDGNEAVELMQAEDKCELVTLDYFMDKMNGLRVLQRIRSTPDLKDMPVIVVTGADDRRIEMSLFEAGADDFIVKPIDGPLFVLRIQAVLRRRQLA